MRALLRLRLFLALLLWVAGFGCAPKIIHPQPVTFATPPPIDEIEIEWPVDIRPPDEQRPGGFYTTYVPVPLLIYGDQNLRPGSSRLVYDTVENGLQLAGFSTSMDGDSAPANRVRVFVLHHLVREDRSDAQWVSTVSGGIMGYIGAFFYPLFVEAEVHLRLEFHTPEGILVRDVRAARVRRSSVAKTWGIWSFFQKDWVATTSTGLLEEIHTDLRTQISKIASQVNQHKPITAGIPPTDVGVHALEQPWRTADSVSMTGQRTDLQTLKYPHRRFSPVSGHDLHRREVIGRISLPLDTFGYEIASTHRVHTLIDLTLLGLLNSASVGIRLRPLATEHVSFGVEAKVGAYLALQTRPTLSAHLGGTTLSGAMIFAWRPDEITFFLRGGINTTSVYEELEGFSDLAQGNLVGWGVEPGLEFQISQTTALALQLKILAQYQEGNVVLTDLGPVLVLPQVGLGFR